MPGPHRPSVARTCAALALSLAAAYPWRTPELAWPEAVQTDLDGDGTVETLWFDRDADQTVRLCRPGRPDWVGIPHSLKPWKMVVADVEGDGVLEVAIGVHKPTPYRPFPHNCLYVYGVNREGLFPKWRGSALSHPFTNYTFAEQDGTPGDELVALETDLDGLRCVTVYHWKGFGFAGETLPGRWREAELVETGHGGVTVRAEGRWVDIPGGAR
ncbi:MAG TPA: VCBS repeat-containing protein [Armatimonadota bacterium]|nr:VCBS repeat-containing protein [Armatimonadota bacterium]HQK93308.1 VCBS repeat-containing protein [Armatimonadota bacterium]